MEIDERRRPEVDVARAGRARARVGKQVRPRADQELLCGAGRLRHRVVPQTAEVRQAALQEDVVPGRHVVHGHRDLRVLALDVDPPPRRAVVRMLEIVREIASRRRELLRPGHQRQAPVGLGRQRRGPRGRRRGELALELGPESLREPAARDRVARHQDRVRDLPPELERAARVIHPALVEVTGRRGGKRRHQMRRPRGREQILRRAEIGLPQRADLAVGVGKLGGPLDGIVAVRRFPRQWVVLVAVGGEAAARVLHDHHVAVLDEDVDVPGAPAQALVVGQP